MMKYEHSKSFGLVNSSTSNVVWSTDGAGVSSRNTGSGRAIVAANEEVLCWEIKTGELLSRWRDNDCKSQVSAIAQSKTDIDIFAVGYEDGSIRLWDSKIATVIVSFNGHKSAITTLTFDKSGVRLASGSRDTDVIVWDLVAELIRGFLLTTGKDALIKLWDMASQHCIETHVAQTNGECWALGTSPDGSGCITAGNDGEMKVWSIDTAGLYNLSKQVNGAVEARYLQGRGILHRQGKDRALEISFHPRLDYFSVHGSEKSVEIWRIRSEEEVKKSLARKRRRRREKMAANENSAPEVDDADEKAEDISTADITDFFVPYVIVRTGGKVRSIDWIRIKGTKSIQLLIGTTNNQLEVYTVATKDKNKKSKNEEMPDYSRTLSVEMPGHRADIRALALSSDDRMTCIRSFECGYALCCAFLPGDKIVVVGTKSGELELFDVASAAMLETIKAHESAIWSLHVHPDGRSVVSGSADKSAKFWNFEVFQEEIPGTKRTIPKLRLVHTRTLKVSDDILSLKFSPDARLLAVALLDNTVKVFFVDSLKLFLNLYGHKLPVLSMDISFDSKLIVTCSADKNIRLWGLDFGDCHKAFFGHQDSIYKLHLFHTAKTAMDIISLVAIVEALEIGTADLELMPNMKSPKPASNTAPPARNLLFMALGNISAERHVLNTFQKIKAAALHDALLVLHSQLFPCFSHS
ncbi:hypothetical protein DID88_009811 [Monilinia fructigena]|uniref:Anaphase-promoting complex subunit 4 WD40 domain-containing protein n=1 Tax=Monilinia fructigena TaxID=38457 RepID=A0A395IDQ7_9HELO|nr:hypothetical protein DID88_009811 [Monilinia fructigena]